MNSLKPNDKKNSIPQTVISTIQNPSNLNFDNTTLSQNFIGKKTQNKVKRSFSLNRQEKLKEGFTNTVPNNSNQLTSRNSKGKKLI